MYTDEILLQEMLEYVHEVNGIVDEPSPSMEDFEFRLQRLQEECNEIEQQLLEEQAEHAATQRFLAEIANLGENYRVNWIKEGF